MLPQAIFFFLLSFVVSFLLFVFLRKYRNFGFGKRTGGFYLGIIFLIIFSLFYFLFPQYLLAKDFLSILLGIIILLIGGVWDDLKKTNWFTQLIFQSSAALALIIVGDTIDHIRTPGGLIEFNLIIGGILAYIWIIIIINSLNWFDGVDGLAGSISWVTFMILATLSAFPIVGQPGTVLICLIAAGVLAGFLFFNFRPAFAELGTSGVWILGFLIAAVSIYSGGKVATTALVLGLPILNFIFVSLERILKGKLPVLGGDRIHLHERLEDNNWSNFKIVAVITLISILWGLGALLTQTSGKVFLLFLLIGVFVFLGLLVRSKGSLLKKH